jgi:hypothetical protein
MKEALKERVKKAKGTKCALSGVALPKAYQLYDTDRILPKAKGGIYDEENTRLLIPTEHMKRHGNYREREPEIEELKSIIDDREQMRKLHQKINNQMLAYERHTDCLNETTKTFLESQGKIVEKELALRDRALGKWLKVHSDNLPIAKAMLGVKGIGPISTAYMLAYIDIDKAEHASSLWKYCGLDCPSHERYKKGETSGGNKTLRTVLYTMAESQVKNRGEYRYIYDQVKERLSISEKITKSRNTQGILIECMWKDTKPCHRHGAALRAVMKHFLADYWYAARELAGLPTTPLYAESMLGHEGGTIKPKERGWEY